MNILIIGANQGIGAAMAAQWLDQTDHTVITTSRQYGDLTTIGPKHYTVSCDVTDESTNHDRITNQRDQPLGEALNTYSIRSIATVP